MINREFLKEDLEENKKVVKEIKKNMDHWACELHRAEKAAKQAREMLRRNEMILKELKTDRENIKKQLMKY